MTERATIIKFFAHVHVHTRHIVTAASTVFRDILDKESKEDGRDGAFQPDPLVAFFGSGGALPHPDCPDVAYI